MDKIHAKFCRWDEGEEDAGDDGRDDGKEGDTGDDGDDAGDDGEERKKMRKELQWGDEGMAVYFILTEYTPPSNRY